jgi:uncharacterized membrane protein YfcA
VFILFVPVGVIIGVLAGFFGIGGGLALMPVLLLVGMNPAEAVSTSLMFTFGAGAAGALAHARMGRVKWERAVLIGLTGIFSAQFASRIIVYISGRYDFILNLLIEILMLAFVIRLFREKQDAGPAPVVMPYVPASLLTGLFAGFLSSLLGIGGGIVIIPLLTIWQRFTAKIAIGTSSAAIMIVSAGGLFSYAGQLRLNWLVGICLIAGALIGTPLGAMMTGCYDNRAVSRRLGALYCVTMLSMLLDMAAAKLPQLQWGSLLVMSLFIGFMLLEFLGRLLKKNKKTDP